MHAVFSKVCIRTQLQILHRTLQSGYTKALSRWALFLKMKKTSLKTDSEYSTAGVLYKLRRWTIFTQNPPFVNHNHINQHYEGQSWIILWNPSGKLFWGSHVLYQVLKYVHSLVQLRLIGAWVCLCWSVKGDIGRVCYSPYKVGHCGNILNA